MPNLSPTRLELTHICLIVVHGGGGAATYLFGNGCPPPNARDGEGRFTIVLDY